MVSDIEDLDLSDYSNFELETEHSSEESNGSDDDIPVIRNVLPASPIPPSRGAGILRTHNLNIPPDWGTNTDGFVTQQFTPHHTTDPKDIPANINAESSPPDFLSLFWDDVLWDLLVTETKKQAINVESDKPNC